MLFWRRDLFRVVLVLLNSCGFWVKSEVSNNQPVIFPRSIALSWPKDANNFWRYVSNSMITLKLFHHHNPCWGCSDVLQGALSCCHGVWGTQDIRDACRKSLLRVEDLLLTSILVFLPRLLEQFVWLLEDPWQSTIIFFPTCVFIRALLTMLN